MNYVKSKFNLITHEWANNTGFTLTELLVTISIMALLAVAAIPIYGNLQVSSQLNESTSLLVQTLRTARENAESRVNASAYGVKINSQSYTLYQGSSYATRDSTYDRLIELDPTLSLTSTFSNNELNFSKGLAQPSEAGTITLTHTLNEVRHINVNSLGLVQED